MKPQVGVGMRQELICDCCKQPYYPDKVRQDLFDLILLGAEPYSICPVCTQAYTSGSEPRSIA
jgi:hypothetical protein